MLREGPLASDHQAVDAERWLRVEHAQGALRLPRLRTTFPSGRTDRPRRLKHALEFVVAIVVIAAAAFYWIERPDRIASEFASLVHVGEYGSAAGMLSAPSAIEAKPDGTLVLTDRNGKSVSVTADKLPFAVSGAARADSKRFPGATSTMLALGSSANGILDSPPVALRLSHDGSGIHIEGVDPRHGAE